MIAALGALQSAEGHGPLFNGGFVEEGYIELRALHIQVNPDHPLLFGQEKARLDGVVEEVAEDGTELDLRDPELHRDVRVGRDRDPFGLRQGYLAVDSRS